LDLEILYKDDYIVAINKPNGLLVHKSSIAKNADTFALQLLRNQLGQRVYPLHRLDRKTSGALLFGIDPENLDHFSALFRRGEINKIYHAIVRGYINEEGTIDYAISNFKAKVQEAKTQYRCLGKYEIAVPSAGFQSSRYSLAELVPATGRMHQLRKHMAHIFHPIIGDRPYGCNKQNRMWKEKWEMTEMLLHAKTIEFVHPVNGRAMSIEASYLPPFRRAFDILEMYQ
jgi:tRNA pseudouridine65 synthase